jgi:septal ring factor EnvC (AmiA/AmiB activator)
MFWPENLKTLGNLWNGTSVKTVHRCPILRATARVFVGCAVAVSGRLFAQDYTASIREHQKNLAQIKNELTKYESEVRRQTKKEKSELDRLNQANRKVALLQQLIGELEVGRKTTELNIQLLQRQLQNTEEELKTLQRLVADRLLQVYKHREEDPLALVLTSASVGEAYARMKYFRLIYEQDKRDVRLLRQKKDDIEERRAAVQLEFNRLKSLIAEKQNERTRLDDELHRRRQSLTAIQKDKKMLASMIDQKKEDLETMRSLIVALEKKRLEEESHRAKAAKEAAGGVVEKRPTFIEKSSFHLYRKQLPYPAAGRVVKKFGDQIHPVHGTKTRNPGIELLTTKNASVYAVAKGQVTVVTWLRRFGNTVMIDHGGGYYTVYAYLSEMYVSANQIVSPGDVIARVDESENGQPLLYFAIFKDREPLDPIAWLK